MFKNLSIRAVLTTAPCVFFALFLVTGIAVYQQLTSNRTSIEVMLDTNLVRANAVDDAGSELLRARLVLLAAQTTLLEGKSIDNLASMQRLDGYTKKAADLIQSARQNPETSPVGKPLFDEALALSLIHIYWGAWASRSIPAAIPWKRRGNTPTSRAAMASWPRAGPTSTAPRKAAWTSAGCRRCRPISSRSGTTGSRRRAAWLVARRVRAVP